MTPSKSGRGKSVHEPPRCVPLLFYTLGTQLLCVHHRARCGFVEHFDPIFQPMLKQFLIRKAEKVTQTLHSRSVRIILIRIMGQEIRPRLRSEWVDRNFRWTAKNPSDKLTMWVGIIFLLTSDWFEIIPRKRTTILCASILARHSQSQCARAYTLG